MVIKRKVILHGPSTLTISLPSKWAKAQNINKGDELNVEETGAFIKVYPGEEHLLTKKTSVDFSELDKETIRVMLSVLYESGYDELLVSFKEPKTVHIVQELISPALLGYETVEQRSNACIVRNVTGDHFSELESLIRRAFLVTLSLAENSLTEIKKGSISQLNELLVLEKTNNKLTNYCHRLINKQPYKDKGAIYKYIIVWVFESICDDYRDLIKLILGKKNLRFSPAFLEAYQGINNLVRQYYSLFYKYSDEDFMGLRNSILELKRDFLKKRFNEQEGELRYYLFSILNRLYDCLGSTIGMHH
ncbi:MAG TPA: AbrB/MazE/SpoVT family DNA-binding domain-containing protein [Candidatus Nanoarchaeia archaeon]|nr:AbrB/MazE/SpoVT family DNA-binding domain-containing protein [Candidatus Nanoarchaeia archaeon]